MSNERVIDAIKKSKPFKAGDALIYSVVLVMVVALFLYFVILPATAKTSGFSVTVGDQLYCTFNPTDGGLVIADGKESFIECEYGENGATVTVYSTADKSEYNVIFFDTVNGTAEVTESNCSTSHDCTFIPKIKDGGAIYCAPHRLKVVPTESDGFTQPITG